MVSPGMQRQLELLEQRFAPSLVPLASGAQVALRESGKRGTGPTLVLLHGIGSGSGSWVGQFDALAASFRVIAWDAPGYGQSDPLANLQPLARDYAHAIDELLAHLGVDEAFVLGHSLGAIVAAAWASTTSCKVRGLVLASPARGYATASAEVRDAKYLERVQLVERLGVHGMAAERSAALCAPDASPQSIALVRDNMALVTPGGYSQAAWMLAHDDLMSRLRNAQPPLAVLCGEHDRTTPPTACERIAHDCGAPFVLLRGVAHACYIEDPAQFNAALLQTLSASAPTAQRASHV